MSKFSIVIGIDPGASGCIAIMECDGVTFQRLDGTEADIAAALAVHRNDSAFAFIERVHSMPKQGVASSFKFGQSYGFLRGLLFANGIPFEEVAPQKWQKAMGCMTKGDKRVSKARAQQLFPHLHVVHANADALLIAEYGRRLLRDRSDLATDAKYEVSDER